MPRMTLPLGPDVQQLVEEAMRRDRASFEHVVNGAIRHGLRGSPQRRTERYVVVPHETELRPAFDPARPNQLVDGLEVDERRAPSRPER